MVYHKNGVFPKHIQMHPEYQPQVHIDGELTIRLCLGVRRGREGRVLEG